MKDVVRRGKGRMEGQVAWLGSPLSLDYPSMDGAFYVNVEAGQFLKADPGMAKLLGVLSLQSLPRRLALDFRDVFSEGFAFDFVRGDVTIQDGIAATNNLQMKGVNAAVLMEGRADIAKRDAGPESGGGARDQRRHGIAGCHRDQSGDRAGHLPRADVPARAAHARGDAGVSHRRHLDRPAGRPASTASPCPRAARTLPPKPSARAGPTKTLGIPDHESCRNPDGVGRFAGGEPGAGPRPAGAGCASRRASWRCCPNISASWATRTATSSRRARASATAPIQRFLAQAARELGLWIVGGTLAAGRGRRSPRAQQQHGLFAGGRAGGALRQDPPVPVRQRARALRRVAASSNAAPSPWRSSCETRAGTLARRHERLLRPALSRAVPRA